MILAIWQKCTRLPLGTKLFSFWMNHYVPYTGSIRSEVKELSAGHARVRLRDRRKLRNHLNSIHAIALLNLGEFVSGLALMAGLPANARGIPKKLSIEYLKKARGTLSGVSDCTVPKITGKQEFTVLADIFDEAGDCVARVQAVWMLDLKKEVTEG